MKPARRELQKEEGAEEEDIEDNRTIESHPVFSTIRA
jgi:hypothetical protein